MALKELAKLLDVADEARRALLDASAVAPANESVKLALNAAPQFIVCGPQSAGKSSILSRLSGIKFPTHQKRCTRVASALHLRRGEESPVEVRLRGEAKDHRDANAASVAVDEEFPPELGDTDVRIKAAQDRALTLCGYDPDDENAGFVASLEIEVRCTRPDIPNVTLIDLPGFVSEKPGTNEKAEVETMVRRFAEMEGSLILWVVNTNQDFDTSLGKHVIFPHRHKAIVVLTMVDESFKKDDHGVALLRKIVDDTSAPRVVVLGKQPPGTKDEDALCPFAELLTTVDGEVERGLPALRDIVERRMYDHLRKQLPDLARVVQDAVEAVKLRLNQVARRAPLADATIAQGVVRARLGDQVYHKRRLDYLRREGDALQCKIKNLRLRAIREVDKGVNIGRKAENEELFEGSEVLVGVPGEEFLQAAVLTSVKGGSEVEYRLTAKTTTGMVARDKVWSTASGPERMVQDVRALAQELRGIRNLAHVDPQPIIEAYVTDWASRYETVLKEAARRVAASAKEWVDAWFSLDTLPVTTAPLVGALHEEMHARLAKLDTEALHAMARIVRYNRPPLVLTTNDHYLESRRACTATWWAKTRREQAMTARPSCFITACGPIGKCK